MLLKGTSKGTERNRVRPKETRWEKGSGDHDDDDSDDDQ